MGGTAVVKVKGVEAAVAKDDIVVAACVRTGDAGSAVLVTVPIWSEVE